MTCVTYEPAGAPIDPARGEAIVASAEGRPGAQPDAATSPFSQVARPVTKRAGMPAPVKAAAVGGAGVLAGLAIAALVPRRKRGRVIVAPGRKRGKRKLKTTKTTSVLVDLHLLD